MKSFLGLTDIEKAFYKMGRSNPKLQEYFFTYYSQKLIFINHFYDHIPEKLPGYTDHGKSHVERILTFYSKILEDNIPGFMDDEDSNLLSGEALNYYEIYLLLCATIWHDIGNLLGRVNHNTNVNKIAERLRNNFFVDDEVKTYAMQIASAHTGVDSINNVIPYSDRPYNGEEVNLRFLGALLRFVDEIEEGILRCDEQYYNTMKDQIKEDNRIHWETGICIKRIYPMPNDETIKIQAIANQIKLFETFEKNGRKIALIDELIFKIDKINEERKYLSQFVRKYISYKKIDFELNIENGNLGKLSYEFNDTQGYKVFWRLHNEINPEEKIGGYSLQGGARLW